MIYFKLWFTALALTALATGLCPSDNRFAPRWQRYSTYGILLAVECVVGMIGVLWSI